MDSVQILIRKQGSSERYALQLPIDLNDTIGDISEKVSKKIGLSTNFMKIIFCGRRLDDGMSVKELKLGPQTCLTVTVVDEFPGLDDKIPSLLTSSTNDYEIINHPDEPDFKQKTNTFYVFCKKCEKLNTAKLRAYCSDCGNSSIEFLKEPTKWDDVIGSGKIEVNCQSCESEKTARFVFKCVDCNEEGAVLPNIKTNIGDHECLICGEVEPLLFALNCGHTSCVACFSAYLGQINDQWLFFYKTDVGFSMKCIMVDCESYVKDVHVFYLLGIDKYKEYQRKATEKYLHIQDGFNFCPYTDCGASFMVDDLNEEENSNFVCPECKRLFCLKCKSRADCTCNSEDKSNELINIISKPCPNCKAPTERNGGCSHLRCQNCTFEWCYLCGEWCDECQWNHWFD